MKKKALFIITGVSRIFRFRLIFFLCTFSFLTGLSFFSFTPDANRRNLNNLHVIDLTNLPKEENPVYLSQIASDISYLPLESSKECLIGPSVRFKLFDSIVISSAHHQILTFDLKNGKFLKSIGEYNRGPDGFMNSWGAYIKNREIIITAKGWDYHLIEFSVDGEIVNKLKLDKYPRDIAWLSDNLYAIYYKKVYNSDSLRLQVYDIKKNKVVSVLYDNRKFQFTPTRTTNYGAFFYYYNNDLSIKEYFNDTVFRVTTNKLIPAFIFKSGKYSPPYFEKHKFDYTQYHNIQNIMETDDFIFFQLYFKKRGYSCYYDKRTKRVKIPNYKDLKINGFKNDIDGFMQFQPISVSNRNELIGFLESYKIVQWFDENPDKGAELPPHVQKLRNIKETDNPVVVIAKLKE